MSGPILFSLFRVLTFTLQTTCKNAQVRVSKSRNRPSAEGDLKSQVVPVRNAQRIAKIGFSVNQSAPSGVSKFILRLQSEVFFRGVDITESSNHLGVWRLHQITRGIQAIADQVARSGRI